MAKKLKGVWRQLTLKKDERDTMETESILEAVDLDEGKSWLVVKLLMQRPFNKDALVDVVNQLGKKIGNFIEVDSNPRRPGWRRNICLCMDIDVNKPLRRFVTITRGQDISAKVSERDVFVTKVSNNKEGDDVIVIDGTKNDVSKESTEVSVEFMVDSLPFNDRALVGDTKVTNRGLISNHSLIIKVRSFNVDCIDKGKGGNVFVLHRKVSLGVHVGLPLDSSQLMDISVACSQETPAMRFISVSMKRRCPKIALKGKSRLRGKMANDKRGFSDQLFPKK
ncbi:hypothetical protein PTKIN_Ptkin12aG0090600 [Pterospermum kingtungense]